MQYLFVVLALALISCGSNTREAAVPHDSASVRAGAAIKEDFSFYRKYTGTIAGKPVTAHLKITGDDLSGTYYYDEIGIPIVLWPAGYDEVADRYKAFEAAGEHSQAWSVTVDEHAVRGRWESESREHLIDLKESDGSNLTIWSRADSMRARPALAEPRANLSMQLLVPSRPSLAFQNALLDILPSGEKGRPAPSSLEGLWQEHRDQYFEGYSGTVTEMHDSEVVGTYWLNYEESYNSSVLYDRDQLLVMGIGLYSYTGGAHGNGGTRYINYDQQVDRVLTLTDMMRVDSSVLKQVLEFGARDRFQIAAGTLIKEHLFVDELYVPENYFITHKGITFAYWPYEIASYAEGEIQLFVSWPEIRHLLRPDFISRLKL